MYNFNKNSEQICVYDRYTLYYNNKLEKLKKNYLNSQYVRFSKRAMPDYYKENIEKYIMRSLSVVSSKV